MYFLHTHKTEAIMTKIIEVVLCAQGGLGVFEQGIEYLCESAEVRRMLEGLGFSMEEI
jgi:hypothetical protein